jgi:hypothetical protein
MTLNPKENDWKELIDAYQKVYPNVKVDRSNIYKMIQDDPAIFSEHIDLRVRTMFKHLQEKNGPFKGKIKHYWYRLEYQNRGYPHVHCLLWLDGAPVAGKDSPQEVLSYVSEYVCCRLPEEDETELHRLVTNYQVHNHNRKLLK